MSELDPMIVNQNKNMVLSTRNIITGALLSGATMFGSDRIADAFAGKPVTGSASSGEFGAIQTHNAVDTDAVYFTEASQKMANDSNRTEPWAGDDDGSDYFLSCSRGAIEEPYLKFTFKSGKLALRYASPTSRYCDLMGTSDQKIIVQLKKSGSSKFRQVGPSVIHTDGHQEQVGMYVKSTYTQALFNQRATVKGLTKVCKNRGALMRLKTTVRWDANEQQTFQHPIRDGQGRIVSFNKDAKKTYTTASKKVCAK